MEAAETETTDRGVQVWRCAGAAGYRWGLLDCYWQKRRIVLLLLTHWKNQTFRVARSQRAQFINTVLPPESESLRTRTTWNPKEKFEQILSRNPNAALESERPARCSCMFVRTCVRRYMMLSWKVTHLPSNNLPPPPASTCAIIIPF